MCDVTQYFTHRRPRCWWDTVALCQPDVVVDLFLENIALQNARLDDLQAFFSATLVNLATHHLGDRHVHSVLVARFEAIEECRLKLVGLHRLDLFGDASFFVGGCWL